jgi:hypothetical protein
MNSAPTISYNPIETIKAFGFTRAGSCGCGGTRNEIYKKEIYNLYYRKTRHVFKLKMKNDTVVPITSLTNLETELKKIFPDVAMAQKI